MTRVFLAAGVAALAIAAPASAKPGGHDGGNRVERAQQGGGQHAQRQQRPQRAERAAPRMQQRAERPQRAQRVERVASRPQRAERQQMRAAQVERRQARSQRVERAQQRVAERHQARPQRVERMANRAAERKQMRVDRADQARTRVVQRQQAERRVAQHQQALDKMHARIADRQQVRGAQAERFQNRLADRQQLRADRLDNAQARLIMRNNERFARLDRARAFAPVPARLTSNARIIPVGEATRFIGAPLSSVDNLVTLAALPASVQYLYPATPNYYYQYGNGYVYQVDRSTSLIDALIPLLAGGFMPGTYLPSAYMSSYVPNYYGLNSFYPSSYGYGGYGAYGYADYGYGYGNNICNRYANGVVYQVDCLTGMIENVVPLYASGYGVGQLLPSSYAYYNVPMQYRSLYYDTPDYGYWYAPGAIYQYDRGSSLITSVAALMSPGFTIGQPLPAGYGMYNVPMAYRATYYDTPNAWYRYNNGYIYQIDPTTQLVSAIVASLLT
jgi:hypothetical protein